jgi:DNA-binding CsgD family transcriptional regulator
MLALITQGRSNEEITAACYLSINTVKSYIRDAYRKIGVTTRPQAVAWALRNGLGSSH